MGYLWGERWLGKRGSWAERSDKGEWSAGTKLSYKIDRSLRSESTKLSGAQMPEQHRAGQLALVYNKTISWKRTNSLVNTLNNKKIALSNTDVAENAHRQHRTKKQTYQRQIAIAISWTRQEPRGLVGSSVISDPAAPGSNSNAVSSLFPCHFLFFKVRIVKNSTSFTCMWTTGLFWTVGPHQYSVDTEGWQEVSHMFGNGLRTCAPLGGYYTRLL